MNYLEEEDFTTFFFWFKMTIMTLAPKSTVRLGYFRQRKIENDRQIHKNIYNS